MKKTFSLILISILFLAGCSKKTENTPVKETSAIPFSSKTTDKFDYDFTKMNFNMASGVIFDILVDPEKYENKTIKFDGEFNVQMHEGERYFAAINWDLTGCCPNGLNFIPPESMKYPEDFPEEKQNIVVTGRMEFISSGNEKELCFIADQISLKE